MSLLSAEVLFAPLLVAACTLAARKWGASVAG